MDIELNTDNDASEYDSSDDIESTSGTTVSFYYNQDNQPRYQYKIFNNAEFKLSQDDLIRMKMIRKITMNNGAIKQLRSKTKIYFEKKSPMGAFFERVSTRFYQKFPYLIIFFQYGSIIQMTGTRPSCRVSISPHGNDRLYYYN